MKVIIICKKCGAEKENPDPDSEDYSCDICGFTGTEIDTTKILPEEICWVSHRIEESKFDYDDIDEFYKGWAICLEAPNGGIIAVSMRNRNSGYYWFAWTEHDDHYCDPEYHLAIARQEIDRREANKKPKRNKQQLTLSLWG